MADDSQTFRVNGSGLFRADSVTIDKNAKVTKKFSDLDLDFMPHPISKDIVPLVDAAAVKRSVRNILFTGLNERAFNPNFGANLRQLLFEPITPGTKQTLKLLIENTLKVFEPRVTIVKLLISASPDENAYEVSLAFSIDTLSEIVEYDLFLERLR